MPIEKISSRLDLIVSENEEIKELGNGYGGEEGPAEGPLWWADGGYLLFSFTKSRLLIFFSFLTTLSPS